MKRIAKFHKVSLEQFMEGWKDTFGEQYTEDQIKALYEEIKLPKRATAGSAGYDFYAPDDFVIEPGKTIKIPTGIRVEMEENWVLKCYPRSGLGFKFRLQLNNTVGIIDSDYFYSDNEGHIFAKLTNDTNENKTVELGKGTGFMQGIFVEYGITVDDDATAVRNGGFGSTRAKIVSAKASTIFEFHLHCTISELNTIFLIPVAGFTVLERRFFTRLD